jgi:hypothetical protein
MLQDALRKALSGKEGLATASSKAPPSESPTTGIELPLPEDSEWARWMPAVPAGASLGRWQSDTARRLKELKAQGRRKDARALAGARDQFLKRRDKVAWRAAKRRWTALGWSEKLYRRLKSEDFDGAKVAEKLHTRRADSIGSDGQEAILTWLRRK